MLQSFGLKHRSSTGNFFNNIDDDDDAADDDTVEVDCNAAIHVCRRVT
jgi:hypothetical protein